MSKINQKIVWLISDPDSNTNRNKIADLNNQGYRVMSISAASSSCCYVLLEKFD